MAATIIPMESQIQRACLDLLAAKGIFAYRSQNVGVFDRARGVYRTSGVKGVPDITAILPVMVKDGVTGQYVGIEVKREGEKLSPDQEAFHERIAESGGLALTVHSVDELQSDMAELGF